MLIAFMPPGTDVGAEPAHDSDARFRAIFNQVAVGIAQVDLTGRFELVNERYCELTGRPRDALLQLTMQEITHPDDLPGNLVLLHRLIDKDEPFVVEKRYVLPDGSARWVNNSVSLVRAPDGRPQYVVAISQDIDERKRMEKALSESVEQLRAIVDNSPSIIFLKDLQGRYLLLNHHAHTQLRALPQHAVIGRTDEELFEPEVAAYLRKNDQDVLAAGKTLRFEEREKGDDGRSFISYKFPLFRPDGTAFAVGGIATEITEQNRLQEELRKRVNELADADRRKDEFLATLAHELRNPLAALSNSLYLLKQHEAAPEVQDLRNTIDRQKIYLTRLVDDLLDVSRITRGLIELHFAEVNVEAVVKGAVDAARGSIEQRQHALCTEWPAAPLYVRADVVRLEQIVSNLLSNAAKYTDAGGQISLSVAQDGDHVVLRVRDTGIGMDAAILPHVFDLFTQAERSYARTHGGLGIGLHIVQRLVHMHGGTVSAYSDGLGCGSEFIVRLPLVATAAPGSLEAKPASAGQAMPRRILVIEDNRDAAETLMDILELGGHEVSLAFSGPQGLQVAASFAPEVVVCDIGLPGLDGYEVARRLRQAQSHPGLVLIALTGFGQQDDEERAREAGFDHHLTKPVEIEELQRVIALDTAHRK